MKNNTNKFVLILLCTFLAITLNAQESILLNYDWENKMTVTDAVQKYTKENEVILSKIIKLEYVPTKDNTIQYYLIHQKILVNSDDAINKYNKIYLPSSNKESIEKCKVRILLKSGKQLDVNTKDIKEEIDEEKDIKYNYFAVNGVEKGAIIEKLFLFKQVPDLNGKTFFLQDEFPIEHLELSIIHPNHIVFKTKSYNGLPEPQVDKTTLENKVIVKVEDNFIKPIKEDDKYSNWKKHVKMFRFKLDENLARGAKNIYNFKSFSVNVYENLNKELDKKSLKAIDEFFKNVELGQDLQSNIWQIEDKIKKNINYNKYFDTKESLAKVIESKQANQTELIKLFVNVFKKYNIDFQIVFASDRFSIPFDKSFESYENLDEVLFYFPAIDQYLFSTGLSYRIPMIPYEYAENNALFIKVKEFSGTKMPYGEVSQIKILDSSITHDVMNIVVDFTKDFQNPIIDTVIQFGGYSNVNLQPIKDFVEAEQYQTILKDIAQNYTGSSEFLKLETQYDGIDFLGKKPFTLKVAFEGKNLIKKAGDDYLFTIGETIGKQTELYQENSRKLPVEINYPHAYSRKITLLLPNNITIKNLEKLNLDYKTIINSKTEAQFTSEYVKKGTDIEINNIEYYNIVNYPLESFDSYKSVINAAADFNKQIIVLTKNKS